MPLFSVQRLEREHFLGTAPSVFVGTYNYPNLNVGILAPPEQVEGAELYDSPREWSSRNFHIPDVLQMRGALINSRFTMHIKTKPRFLELTQEVAMASKPTDVEFFLEKKPVYRLETSGMETVLGAHAPLKRALLTENPKISSLVEKVFSDTDLKAKDALVSLYAQGFDETFLTRLLSVGTLGVNAQRKLVPTRWSITATDDTLGKALIEEAKKFPVADFQLFFGGYLGNYFLIVFFPKPWSYELFEMAVSSPGTYTTDYEFFDGRTSYAEHCVGGYYSVRLAVLEKLRSLKRQASVLVMRFITGEYTVPLGVWVTREAARKALCCPYPVQSFDEVLQTVQKIVAEKFRYPLDPILHESKVLQHIKTQRTIFDFKKV